MADAQYWLMCQNELDLKWWSRVIQFSLLKYHLPLMKLLHFFCFILYRKCHTLHYNWKMLSWNIFIFLIGSVFFWGGEVVFCFCFCKWQQPLTITHRGIYMSSSHCTNWSYWCKSQCSGRKRRFLRVNLTAICSSSLEWESNYLQITSSGLKIKQTTAGWLIQRHSISHPPEFSKQDVFFKQSVLPDAFLPLFLLRVNVPIVTQSCKATLRCSLVKRKQKIRAFRSGLLQWA